MPKMLTVDQERCTGCRQCELVCSVHNTGASNPSRARISVVKWESEGFYLPMVCQQCQDAACVAVCPKNALSRDATEDRVLHDRELCIGCKMCVMACPFGAMGVDTTEQTVIKCNHCEGEPTCVKFCEAGTLKYVDSATVNLTKKRAAGARLSELLKNYT